MADISKINLSGTVYNIKDATARANLNEIQNISDAEIDEITDFVLESLPSSYIYGYETAVAMQADLDLQTGMIAHTNGFTTSGDGDAAYYTISNSGTVDGSTILALQNGLRAIKISENSSVTNGKIVDRAITTPKIADNAITADKIANSAVDGLRIMSTTQLGVAKVGAGLAMNGDALELDGNGDIATAVTSWLNAHPEATTTVQDNSITDDKLVQTGGVLEEVDNIRTDLDALDDINDSFEVIKSRNLFNGNFTDGYIAANGSLYASTIYSHTDKINVTDYRGHTLYFGRDGSSINVRFLCAYDDSGDVIESAGSNSLISSYTVPLNVSSIVVSTDVVARGFSIELDYLESLYTGYYHKVQIKNYPPINRAINIPKPTILTAQALAHDETLNFGTYNYNSVKRGNQVFSVYCKVPNGLDDDGYVIIGKTSANGYAFGVSASKWNYFINGSPLGDGVTHGLTIRDYLFVQVKLRNSDGVAEITIKTNGGTYSRTNTSWSGHHGAPYCSNTCTVSISDVVFTWTCPSLRHRIWIFGDSYVTIAETRWPYYLYTWGFNENILINGYPGETTQAGFNEWRALLGYGTPSVALWCYGMNNSDSGAINQDWLSRTRIFLKDCEDNDITPILATIPCTPVADNSYKNAWVRSSGYRYIEFADAVNTTRDATTWFDGMLSSDNIHPDVQGAIALACRAVNDVPELLIN